MPVTHTPALRLERRHESVPAAAAPQITTLLQYWSDHHQRVGVPSRREFEPLSLRRWLGHISVYEAVDGGADFRNRLEGTAIVELTGEDWTGRFASAVDKRYGSAILPAMREVMKNAWPAIHTMKVYQDGFKDITRLLLPIRSHAQATVDQVFLVIYLDPASALD